MAGRGEEIFRQEETGEGLAEMYGYSDLVRKIFPVETVVLAEGAAGRINTAISELTEKQRAVILARFGIDSGTPKKLSEIAADLKVTPQRVSELEMQGLRHLRRRRFFICGKRPY